MSCTEYEEQAESEGENWKAYLSLAEKHISYETKLRERNLAEEEINYKINRPVDGEVWYGNGNFLTIHEVPLEDGLLGRTNTVNYIDVTTENKYGHTTDEILTHEKLHVMNPNWGEYTLRIVTDHNDSIDVGLELRSLDDKEKKEYEKAYA